MLKIPKSRVLSSKISYIVGHCKWSRHFPNQFLSVVEPERWSLISIVRSFVHRTYADLRSPCVLNPVCTKQYRARIHNTAKNISDKDLLQEARDDEEKKEEGKQERRAASLQSKVAPNYRSW